MNDTLTLQPPESARGPGSASLDLETIAIFGDGSGKASEKEEENLKTIREREEVLKLLKLFVVRHRETLAGLWWRVAYLDPEIDISPGLYRGQRAEPMAIAMLWPKAKWMRVTPKYEYDRKEGERHWEAVVDGVRLRIKNAERVKIIVRGPNDGPVHLPNKNYAAPAA